MSVYGEKQTFEVNKTMNGRRILGVCLSLSFISLLIILNLYFDLSNNPLPDFSHLSNYCAAIPSIGAPEFFARQLALANKLHELNADAYIAEPGANTQFYANFSNTDWFLSERPLLLIITAEHDANNNVLPKVTILTPKFEATRASHLPIPDSNPAHFVAWAEDASPYHTALSALGITAKRTSRIFVDSSVRKFIADGLAQPLLDALLVQTATPDTHSLRTVQVSSAPLAITRLRERKSQTEIALLKCANEATVLAIRAVHQHMYIGMHESEARGLMARALAEGGLKGGSCLTLFGENAALPHGSGSDRALGQSDLALFDCTASLHGYFSDVTRTVALPISNIPLDHARIWGLVHAAQTVAIRTAKSGAITRNVDEAARRLLTDAGYGAYFTHRLGHGIGLEVHEAPYLRGGSNDVIETGHSFSDEPGVYIEGKVGVRLEDCFYISENGTAVYLTAGVGGPSKDMFNP